VDLYSHSPYASRGTFYISKIQTSVLSGKAALLVCSQSHWARDTIPFRFVHRPTREPDVSETAAGGQWLRLSLSKNPNRVRPISETTENTRSLARDHVTRNPVVLAQPRSNAPFRACSPDGSAMFSAPTQLSRHQSTGIAARVSSYKFPRSADVPAPRVATPPLPPT
jgi:hypothetical protein